MNENQIGSIVINCCMAIHKDLGPGLLESVYEIVLLHKLREQGLKAERQMAIPINYQGIRFDEGFRADIVIDNKVILEIKSVETLHNAHKKQLLTYLKLTSTKLGYVLNFGEALMKDGIIRIVNRLEEPGYRKPRYAQFGKEAGYQ